MAEHEEQAISRRGFLAAAAVTAAAATATGAGAAFLKQAQQPSATIATVPGAAPTLSVPLLSANTAANAAANDTFAQLAAAQAENMRLQAALDAANRQLTAGQQHDASTLNAHEAIQVELATANERVSLLAGLLALYEQLEGVDLDAALQDGMTAVSTAVTDMLTDIPTLEESLAAGTLALAEVENHLPVLANGQAWLQAHLGKLDGYFRHLEGLLIEAVEAAGPFLQMINDWFAGVKKWLPFGIGEKAATIMQSVTTLLMETPGTITGLNTNIAQPLDVWLARDAQNEMALTHTLVKPLRDDVMVKTGDTLAKARGVQSVYTTQLQQPVHTAVAQKQILRNLITDYRQQHQV